MARRRALSEKAKDSPIFRRTLKTLRKRMKELRQMHGLSYRELEERSGLVWRQLVALETGEPSNPTLTTLTRLAQGLGVEPWELLSPAQSGVRRKKATAKSDKTG